MQPTEDFLRLVTPAGGFKFLAIPHESGRGFAHTVFTDHDDMAQTSYEWDEQGGNVYFALAGFLNEWVDGVNAQGHKVRQQRTHENVGFLRSLWVDLDVEQGNPKKYSTQQEAIVDLIRFTRAAGLPVPTIVNSGGGVHAYWPFEQDVPRASWKTLATMFKQVTVALGLKADPSRTADESSVLRVPGTTNRKPGKGDRPVTLVGGLTRATNVVELAKVIKAAFDANQCAMPKPAAAPVTGMNADLIGGMGHEPVDLDRIIARCPQVGAVAAARGNVEEPLWYSTLGLARHCVDGAARAHDLSDGHPGYSATATDRKMQQLAAKDVGPTTCARFDSLNPGVCPGCPHFGSITSPVQLGKDEEIPAAEPAEVEVDGVIMELPEPPFPFIRTQAGQIVMMVESEDENEAPQPVVVYQYDLYPVARYYDEYERKYHTKFHTYQPKRGQYDFDIPNEVLYDLKALSKTLANNDVLPSGRHMKALGDYIVGYVQKLQQIAETSDLFMQMGWRDNDSKFVVGNKVVSTAGVVEVEASAISAKATEKFTVNGTLDEWKEIVSHYSKKGNEALLFGFLTAFGAPLFKFTGFNGAILNMMGPSGTGKSTVLKAVNTVYGEPDCAFFQLMDTEKSFYRRVGVLNNLPVAFDEITNIDPRRLSDLCYDFTQGRERMRLTSQAMERRDTFRWQTIMLSSANASLHSRLWQNKTDASAESVRVFEYNVAHGEAGDALELKRVFDRLGDHYGHAGPLFLAAVMEKLDEVKRALGELTDRIYTEAKLPSSERFWAAIIAANLTGGRVAKELGLVQYDEDRMLRWTIARIHEMRGVVEEYKRSPVDIVSDWLAKLVPNTLVVNVESRNPFAPSSFILPRGELRVRYDRPAGKFFIPVSVVQDLCRADNTDSNTLRRELTAMGVMFAPERKVLGAGTEFQTGQTRCWVINARSPLMTDHAEDVAAQAAADGVVTGFRARK